MIIDFQYMQARALKAKESGNLLDIDPDIMLTMVSLANENIRIRDIQRDQIKDLKSKLAKIKRVLE